MSAKSYIQSINDNLGPEPSKYNRGDRVRLGEFDNGCEIIPEEDGVVLSVNWHGQWSQPCYMYVVEVDEKFRTDPTDDGLRELDEDQIKEKL